MRLFDAVVVNSERHADHLGSFEKDNRTIVIQPRSNNTYMLFRDLLKNHVKIEEIEFENGGGYSGYNGTYLIRQVDEESILLQK